MANSKVPKTLDEGAFKWIENVKKNIGHPQELKNAERQRYFHIRKVALKEIEDLTKLAECLPEDQLAQIFNDEKLRPFLGTLLHFSAEHGVSREKNMLIYTPEAEARRQRLLKLCYDIITTLDGYEFAEFLAPTICGATAIKGDVLAHLSAIYYQSLTSIERIIVRKTT